MLMLCFQPTKQLLPIEGWWILIIDCDGLVVDDLSEVFEFIATEVGEFT